MVDFNNCNTESNSPVHTSLPMRLNKQLVISFLDIVAEILSDKSVADAHTAPTITLQSSKGEMFCINVVDMIRDISDRSSEWSASEAEANEIIVSKIKPFIDILMNKSSMKQLSPDGIKNSIYELQIAISQDWSHVLFPFGAIPVEDLFKFLCIATKTLGWSFDAFKETPPASWKPFRFQTNPNTEEVIADAYQRMKTIYDKFLK